MPRMRIGFLAGLILLSASSPGSLRAGEATVGMPVKMEQVVLPGPELEVKPNPPEESNARLKAILRPEFKLALWSSQTAWL